MLKWLLRSIAVLVVLVLAVVGYVFWKASRPLKDYSDVPKPNVTASQDPEVIARGEYVVHALAHCSACHGAGEFTSKHQLPPDKKQLTGGYEMNGGPFGVYYPVNLTSDPETGIAKLSDGDIARVVRHGVDRNGHLTGMMLTACAEMADEDLTAVVSYLRTLPPVKNATRQDDFGYLIPLFMDSITPRLGPPPKYVAPGGVSRERGEYIANGPGHCHGCHTEIDLMNGFAQVPPRFAGMSMAEPDPTDAAYEFVSPNLTPDPDTGVIASFTEEAFVARFRQGRQHAGSKMPWENFQQMTDDDLKSLFAYLHGLPPTKREVGPGRRLAGSFKPKG